VLQGNLYARPPGLPDRRRHSPARPAGHLFRRNHCCSSAPTPPARPFRRSCPTSDQGDRDRRKGSLSGIVPASAAVRWSTDGGATWTSSGEPVETAYEGNELPSARPPSWTAFEGTESLATWIQARCASPTTAPSPVPRSSGRGPGRPILREEHRAGPRPLHCSRWRHDLHEQHCGRRRRSQRDFQSPARSRPGRESGQTYPLDGASWHTYRITTLGTAFNLYIDEAPHRRCPAS